MKRIYKVMRKLDDGTWTMMSRHSRCDLARQRARYYSRIEFGLYVVHGDGLGDLVLYEVSTRLDAEP